MVHVHVLEAGLDLVGARAHVLVGHAAHGHLVPGHADGRVDAQQRALQVLVVPPVGGEALRAGHHGELSADEGDLPHGGAHDPRPNIVVLLREAVHPHIGWFHHVVVDGDDPGHVGHGASVPPGLTVRQVPGDGRGGRGGETRAAMLPHPGPVPTGDRASSHGDRASRPRSPRLTPAGAAEAGRTGVGRCPPVRTARPGWTVRPGRAVWIVWAAWGPRAARGRSTPRCPRPAGG